MDPRAGGVSQAVNMMVKGSENTDVDHEVVCLDDEKAPFLKQYTFTIYALGKGKTAWGYNGSLFQWLKERIDNYHFIVVHGLWQYQNYAVLKAMKGLTLPSVYVMPHGMLDPYFQRAKERRLKAIRNLFFWHLIEKRLIKQAKGILFTCETEKELAGQTFAGYKPKRQYVVGLGIELPPSFRPSMQQAFVKHCGLEEGKPYLLFLSRIHPKKGINILITAYLGLKANGYELPVLVIAGPGMETEYGSEIKKLAQNDPDIIFPGMLAGDIKWGAFYGCEAFVLPSHQENFGIAVVEAMACNKLVLISNQVNIWREIENGQAGFIGHDSCEGVEKLLNNWYQSSSTDKKRMAENAGIVFESLFSLSKTAERLLHVLSEN